MRSTGADEYETTTRERSLADEPILVDADRLPGHARPQERTVLGGKRRPVRAKVVDRLVTGPPEELLLIRVTENLERGRVEKDDSREEFLPQGARSVSSLCQMRTICCPGS